MNIILMNYVANITPEHNTLVLNLAELFNISKDATTQTVTLTATGVSLSNVYMNSVPNCNSMTIDVYPFIVTIRVYFDSKNYSTGSLTLTVGSNTVNISVDDYDVQKLQDTDKDAKQINSKLDTFMLLRTNPKLSGNIKLVVDSDYHLYLDTFKVSSKLNNRIYRKYPISSEGNYPFDVMTVFSKLPKSELYKLPADSLNPHKFFNDYADQYITEYEYGALTNDDNLYSENMKILAPLHIGKHVPDFFVIFRYNNSFNTESYKATDTDDVSKFNTLLKESQVVKIFDLRSYTSIGQYLNNYTESIKEYLYGSCYMQFIEQDNEKYGSNYRQGNNSWRGIDVAKGIITNKIETSYFANNILEKTDSVQELFNDYIINGYQRNNILYPYILNLEFMFNDTETEEFSMHRYFGLYMSANEIVNYDCIISENDKNNYVKKKLDINDNIVNDDSIIKNMFVEKYNDRMFFMTTNNDAMRVQSSDDIQHFISEYVLDNPDKTICSMRVDEVEWHDDEQSFITMTFDEPIHYGEHLRFIALNIQDKSTGKYENICLELVASNDSRLRFTDHNISPYISTNTPELHKCKSSNDDILNNIYRLSFYTQSLSDANESATLTEQFERIKFAIYKFNSFINYENNNGNTISFTSLHDKVYFQHISYINKYDEPEYRQLYIKISKDGKTLKYTGDKLAYEDKTSRINDIKTILGSKIKSSEVVKDNDYDSKDVLYTKDGDDNLKRITTYVNYEQNTKRDSIHYFTKTDVSYMYPISPDAYYFNNIYGVFSLYGYEMLGWRYNNIISFKKIDDFRNPYIIYDDIESVLKNVRHPLVKSTTGSFEVIQKTTIQEGYITDNEIVKLNIIENDEKHTPFDEHTQELILKTKENNIILNPYNVDKYLIDLYNPAFIHNNQVNVYNPESASINIMGIYNIKDIDMSINYDQTEHLSSDDSFIIPTGTVIDINGTNNSLISKGVVYRIIKGGFNEFAALDFAIVGNTLYTKNADDTTYNAISFSRGSLTVSSDLYIKALDGGQQQEYDFYRNIPIQKSLNFYKNKNNTKSSDLYIPVVPQTNCLWESNGLYFDGNSVLNTDELTTDKYTHKGYFTEHLVGPSIDSGNNKYVRNSVDSYANINNVIDSFKNMIVDGKLKNPIKKLLIQNNNIDTAVGYYNTYVQSLEFIYYGIKFNIKFNSDYYTQNLRIGEYNNFEVFIINDYDIQKNNEIYISVDEEIILLINHKYDIHQLNKSYNQLFALNNASFNAPYSVYPAPYSLYSNSLCGTANSMLGAKTLLNYIIKNSNMTDMFFVQDDKPIEQYGTNSNILPNYFYFNVDKNTIDKKSDVIVKSNNDYKIACLKKNGSTYSTALYPNNLSADNDDLWQQNYRDYDSYILSLKHSIINIPCTANTLVSYDVDNVDFIADKIYKFSCKSNNINSLITIELKDKNSEIVDSILVKCNSLSTTVIMKKHITKMRIFVSSDNVLSTGTIKIKYEEVFVNDADILSKYIESFGIDYDCYIINNNVCESIKINKNYQPVKIDLSIPNKIKYNFGYFTPYFYDIVQFKTNDYELQNSLNINLLLGNTKLSKVNTIKTYTGNKVFSQSTTVDTNYFIFNNKSIMSSNWDNNYYRSYDYINQDSFKYIPGYIPGIDDKSFFGSRCMTFLNNHITINDFSNKRSIKQGLKQVASSNNIYSKNRHQYKLMINITQSIYSLLQNNVTFVNNWNGLTRDIDTSMKNYIKNTISKIYNIQRNIDVVFYKKTDISVQKMELQTESIKNYDEWSEIDGFESEFTVDNNDLILTVTLDEYTNSIIHPQIKISRI